MPDSSIIYLVINLPSAKDRRDAMLAQSERFGVDMQIISAISGNDLPPDDSTTGYDRAARERYYTKHLIPNEVACVMSHRKAIKTFLDSPAEYAVIMEDDALLAEHFNEGIRELTEKPREWEVAKLFTDDGKLYPLCAKIEGAVVQPVFPKKLPWIAVGYLYTRHAAEILYNDLQRFWLPADAQIGHILLTRGIPTIGVSPGLIHSSDPLNLHSTLDAEGLRYAPCPPRSLSQCLAYRLSVIRTSFRKAHMRKMMRARINHR